MPTAKEHIATFTKGSSWISFASFLLTLAQGFRTSWGDLDTFPMNHLGLAASSADQVQQAHKSRARLYVEMSIVSIHHKPFFGLLYNAHEPNNNMTEYPGKPFDDPDLFHLLVART
jgi:hypothetical protein